MKYKERHIIEGLKKWLADPHRCAAYHLQQKLDYSAAQYLGPRYFGSKIYRKISGLPPFRRRTGNAKT